MAEDHSPTMSKGLAKLTYHAALLKLVQNTQSYAYVIAQCGEASKDIDDNDPAVDEAVAMIGEALRQAAEKNPGFKAVFAYAAGDARPLIPG